MDAVTGGPSCLTGQRVAQKDCLAFAKFALGGNDHRMGRKELVTGSFDAPNGCSVQSGGDWAAHWNTGPGNNNGNYTPVCSGDGLALQQQPVTDFDTVTFKNVANNKWVEARQGLTFAFLSQDFFYLLSLAQNFHNHKHHNYGTLTLCHVLILKIGS